jgi:hypothetical protein
MKLLVGILLMAALLESTLAGPVTSFICLFGCCSAATACYTAAGFTFGAVPATIVAAIPALTACQTTYAVCVAGCAAAAGLPTP